MISITIFSSKGGVGKTILAINMAYQISKRGIKTLLIDTDIQNNVALYIGEEIKEGLSEFILRDIPSQSIIRKTKFGFSCVTTGMTAMVQTVRYFEKISKEKIQEFLHTAKKMGYEVVIFDTPPGYSRVVEAVSHNSMVLIGILQADPTSFAALKLLSEMLKKIRTKNPKAKTFFVLNMLEPTEVSRDFEKLLTYRLKDALLGTLPYDMNVKVAVGNCQPVEKQNPNSPFSIFLDKVLSNLFAKL